MKPLTLKEKAIAYRKQGYSYNMILGKMNILLSKSTLSNWLHEIPYKPNKTVIKRIGLARLRSALYKHNQKISEIEKIKIIAKKEIGELGRRDLWMLGLGLYLGEGSKLYERVRLINSDPQIIKIAIKWFRDMCGLENKNIIPCIHLYPDIDIKEALYYWSKITNIPIDQFGKTQIDSRKNKSEKKKRKLPYGTLHLQIRSNGRKEFGKNLHRRIMGWIEQVYRI